MEVKSNLPRTLRRANRPPCRVQAKFNVLLIPGTGSSGAVDGNRSMGLALGRSASDVGPLCPEEIASRQNAEVLNRGRTYVYCWDLPNDQWNSGLMHTYIKSCIPGSADACGYRIKASAPYNRMYKLGILPPTISSIKPIKRQCLKEICGTPLSKQTMHGLRSKETPLNLCQRNSASIIYLSILCLCIAYNISYILYANIDFLNRVLEVGDSVSPTFTYINLTDFYLYLKWSFRSLVNMIFKMFRPKEAIARKSFWCLLAIEEK
ncbi:unnamed protein product [Nesidiocoris tenuis]|uniref:Uncharacterized protein n=1 Tax=Nesidiocoris tenuis TaxID=355587 RepID=A0A6H5HYB3_9HEMI|nr:unnamed protein product [Nesidiocoris tenuis]